MRIDSPAVRRRAPSLTPLIDVVFILLVFFMLVTRFADWGELEIGVTERSQGGAGSGPGPATIIVQQHGIGWQGRHFGSAESLTNALKAAQAEGRVEGVLVDAGRDVVLQRVVTIVEALRRAGFEDIQWLDQER